jgi:hypothetical protein
LLINTYAKTQLVYVIRQSKSTKYLEQELGIEIVEMKVSKMPGVIHFSS